MNSKIKEQFKDLACDLSPENLCCDGLLSPAQTRKRYKQIMKKWHELEKEVGHPVSEDDVWGWVYKEMEEEYANN